MSATYNINNAINSNRQMYINLSDFSRKNTNKTNLYSTNKVQYYNVENKDEAKKRKKLSKILILTFSAVSIVGLGVAGAVQILKNKANIQKITENILNTKQGTRVKNAANKFVHFMVNLDALKNDLCMTLFDKLHIRKIDEVIAGGYEKLSVMENAKNFDKHATKIRYFKDALGLQEDLPEYTKVCKELSKEIQSKVSPKDNKVWKTLLEGFKKDPQDKNILDRIKRGFKTYWDKSTKSIIANDNIKDVYKKANGISSSLLPDGITLSKDLYSSDEAIREKALKELSDKIYNIIQNNSSKFIGQDVALDSETYQKAITMAKNLEKLNGIKDTAEINEIYKKLLAESLAKDYAQTNKLLDKGLKDIIEKQRDLKMGNATVDILSMLSTLGMLGASVAMTDDKKEKQSIMLDLGIPLSSTMIFSFVGGLKNIAGVKAMITGWIVGSFASLGVKLVNTLRKDENKI